MVDQMDSYLHNVKSQTQLLMLHVDNICTHMLVYTVQRHTEKVSHITKTIY